MRLPLHVSVHIYEHLQGAREQYFVHLLSWIPLMYVRCVFVQCDLISPGQELQTYIQTDGNDIRPHTAQTYNERTSTESNLVTAQSTAHEHPEDGRKYGPKHVGATLLKYFNMLLSVLNINVNLCFKMYICA